MSTSDPNLPPNPTPPATQTASTPTAVNPSSSLNPATSSISRGTMPFVTTQAKHDIHKFRQITKLTDENWITFKFEMTAALEERGLLEVVEGSESKPADWDKTGQKSWKDRDVCAKAQLIQNLSSEIQPIVYGCKTSAAIWTALLDEFESKNLDKIANLIEVYNHLTYVEGTPLRDHLNKLAILREQMEAMGHPISDTSHALRMIRHLPPSWDGICQVLRATQPTVAKVKDRLMAEEQARKTALTYAHSNGASALAAALQDPTAIANLQALISTQFGSVLLQPGAGKAPSSTSTSTSGAKTSGNKKLRFPDLICMNCKKNGHTKERCWAKGGGMEGKGPKRLRGGSNSSQAQPEGTASKKSEANLAEIDPATTEDVAWVARQADAKHDRKAVHRWILDSGATTHITPNKALFHSYHEFPQTRSVGTADYGSFKALGIGNLWIKVKSENHWADVELKNVLYAPGCASNLLSVNSLTKSGMVVKFEPTRASIVSGNGKLIILPERSSGQLWSVYANYGNKVSEALKSGKSNDFVALNASTVSADDFLKWHERLGHLHWDAIRTMAKEGLVKGLEKISFPSKNPICTHCPYGKLSVAPFPQKSSSKITRPLELVVSDICGPFPPSMNGKRYLLIFMDVYSRFIWPFYIKNRSEAKTCFEEFLKKAERQSGHQVITIRTDNAKEYTEGPFAQYCKDIGVTQQTTAPYSSASNGIAERVFRTIQENGLAALHKADLTWGFWPEAFDCIIYARNRSLHMGIQAIPFTKWFDKSPDVRHLHEFGHLVKVLVHPNVRKKGSYHAEEGRFVGYYPDSRSYKVWISSRRSFVKSRSVLFQDSAIIKTLPRVEPYNPVDLEETSDSPYMRSYRPISVASRSRLPQAAMPSPTPARQLDPTVFRPDSPLSEIDVEEVDGPLPSVNDNILPQQAEGTVPLIRQEAFPEFNARGFRIRPEEHADHPQFQQYGRLEQGRSQRTRKPVNKAYYAPATFVEFAQQLRQPNDTQDLKNGLESLIAYTASLEDPGDDIPESEDIDALLAGFGRQSVTMTYDEAMSSPIREEAEEAMGKEVNQFDVKRVWEVVDLPEDKNAIQLVWVVVQKYDADGKKTKVKARIVAQGFRQQEGVDYKETYAAVPRLSVVRLFNSLVATFGLHTRQLDVVGAYLEAPLTEEVYALPPKGVFLPPGKVFRLHKAVYGLHQSAMVFTKYRNQQLKTIGWNESPAAAGLFTHLIAYEDGTHAAELGLWYVDDNKAGLVEDGSGRVERYIEEVASVLPIEDKGIPRSFLGISFGGYEFGRPNGRIIYAYQPALIDQIAEAARLKDCRPVLTPLKLNFDLPLPSKDDTPHPGFHAVNYRALIGAINYVACCTRPDIANAVRVLAAFCNCPTLRSWKQINNLIAYLWTTRDWVITFGLDSPFILDIRDPADYSIHADLFTTFCDADWAKEPDRVSVSGFATIFNGNLISWGSKKQKGTVALSSMEAEVVAACHGIKEAEWGRKVLKDITGIDFPMNVCIDNHAAIYFGKADVDHSRAKHIDIQYHHIKQAVNDKSATLWYCPTDYQPADLFTKSLRCDRHVFLMRLLGMRRLEEVC